MSAISFSPIRSAHDSRWPSLLELFHSTFPPETREPDEQLMAELDGSYRISFQYLAAADQDHVRAFVRYAVLPEFSFVVHIATAPEHRGQGLSFRLLQFVRAAAPELSVLAEVEPGEAMEWWRRQGAQVLTRSYTQPSLRPETGPVPFHLLALGPVSSAADLVKSFYRDIWELDAFDPMVQRALEGIE